MWIKWKYNDHGHPDFKEVEVPDDNEHTIEEYIVEKGWVPTWSERFCYSRIKWEKINIPSKGTLIKEIESLKGQVFWRQEKIAEYKELLDKLK